MNLTVPGALIFQAALPGLIGQLRRVALTPPVLLTCRLSDGPVPAGLEQRQAVAAERPVSAVQWVCMT